MEQFGVDAGLPDEYRSGHARVLHVVGEILANGEIDRRVNQMFQTNELVDASSEVDRRGTYVGGEVEVDVRMGRPNDGNIQRFGERAA